jgi:hypothetical protein
MPRKSAASLTVVSSIEERRTRVPAPGHLPAPVRAIFDEVTASVSTVHLRRCDSPLIEALAVAIHNNRQATAAIEREGLIVDGRVNAHIGVVDRTSKLIASLSVKLRLTPTGRLDRKVAGQTTRDNVLSPRLDDDAAIDALLDAEEAEEGDL